MYKMYKVTINFAVDTIGKMCHLVCNICWIIKLVLQIIVSKMSSKSEAYKEMTNDFSYTLSIIVGTN